MRHKIVINVSSNPDGEAPVLEAAERWLPRRLAKWMFGDYVQLYMLKPGQSVENVVVKEVGRIDNR